MSCLPTSIYKTVWTLCLATWQRNMHGRLLFRLYKVLGLETKKYIKRGKWLLKFRTIETARHVDNGHIISIRVIQLLAVCMALNVIKLHQNHLLIIGLLLWHIGMKPYLVRIYLEIWVVFMIYVQIWDHK